MKKTLFAHLFVLAVFATVAPTAMAQLGTIGGGTTGGTTTGTGTGQTTSGTGTNTGTNTGTGTGQSTAGLNAEEAFAGIERGDSVGSTAGTGQGFGIGATASPGGGSSFGGGGIGGGGFGGLGGLGGFGGLNSLFGGGGAGGQSTQPAIRTRLRSAIEVDPIAAQRVQQSATSRLQSLPNSRPINGVNVIMDGRTAIVTGVVGSDRDRRMSELLMRLEPGVSRVENRVIISP